MSNSSLARACPRCGSPVKTATLYGLHAVLCGRCDLVMVTRRDLDALANRPMADLPTEEAATEEVRLAKPPGRTSGRPPPERDLWEDYQTLPPARPARGPILGIALVALAVGALIPGAFVAGQWWMGRQVPAPVAEPIVAVAAATPPAAEASVAAATPPEAVAPAPAPAPAPKALTSRQILARAWAEVDRGEASRAEASFREVLRAQPAEAEATYGVGYALVKQDRVQEGRTWLCDALRQGPSVDTQREIVGLLESKRLTCD